MIIEQPKTYDFTDAEREKILPKHPVLKGKYILLTPMIEAAYSIIRERIFLRRTGTFLYAVPRTGKSKCCEAIDYFLRQEFPDIFIVTFEASHSKMRGGSDLTLLKDILNKERVVFPPKIQFDDLLSLLQSHIENRVTELEGDQFVLLTDELQLLSETDLTTLLILQNRLDRRDISMTSIGFAQPDILDMKTSLVQKKANQLIARFLLEPIRFTGCTSEADLKSILMAYDNDAQYPAESGWSFTRFFFPNAYAANFRLADCAGMIWQKLEAARKAHTDKSLLMEHIVNTVQLLLITHRKYDSERFEISEDMVAAAVLRSGIHGYYASLGTNMTDS